jgi:choline dehydrogenase
VGENLSEHWLLHLQFRLRDPRLSHNREFSGLRLAQNALRYLLFRKGVMASGSHEIGAFVRTRPELTRPDAQLMFASYSLDLDADVIGFEREPGMQLFGYLMRPESRGRIAIRSADPDAPPQITPNYLADPRDRAGSVAMVRYIRRLAQQAPLAGLLAGETPHTAGAQRDEEIIDAFRRYGQAGYHVCGTCAMGQDAAAVVDERLRVRGVERLRVIDCSIFPRTISGNTNAPTMAAAWRASDLIAQDHR